MRARCRGFTLIEVVVVIIILGIVFGMGGFIMKRGFDAYFGGRTVSDADAQGRVALERMARELRAIRSATPADLTLGANQIAFTETTAATVSYSYDSVARTLLRNGAVLARGVNGLSFVYLRRDGVTPETTDPTRVYYVTARVDVAQIGGATTIYRTIVHPRSFE